MFKFFQKDGTGIQHIPETVWPSGGFTRLFPQEGIFEKDFALARRSMAQSALYVSQDLNGNQKRKDTWMKTLTIKQWGVISSVHEILHRGEIPPVHPRVESELRKIASNKKWAFGKDKEGVSYSGVELGADDTFAAVSSWCIHREIEDAGLPLSNFDDEFGGVSAEKEFMEYVNEKWPVLGANMHPQVYYSELLGDAKNLHVADFVIMKTPKGGKRGLVVEIHGKYKTGKEMTPSQLKQQAKNIVANERALKKEGWEVLAISRTDVLKRKGPWIKKLENLNVKSAPESKATMDARQVLDGAWVCGRIELSLLHALVTGYWRKTSPGLDLLVPATFKAAAAVAKDEFIKLVDSIEEIWGVKGGGELVSPKMREALSVRTGSPSASKLSVVIDPSLPSYLGWDEDLPKKSMTVRRIGLPVDLGVSPFPVEGDIVEDVLEKLVGQYPNFNEPVSDGVQGALVHLLERLFAKVKYREGQVEGIASCLVGRDRLILLPAGHGKSIIFQTAAFLLPGATIVVEPLNALLNDQIRGLQNNGISRCAAIHSDSRLEGPLADYNLIYVGPERLYIESFREPLMDLLKDRGIDLLIVDETHSVCEYGHSFRVAYLGFRGRLLRIVDEIAQREAPSTLGLTATAVPVVVKDVKRQMGLSGETVSLESQFFKENLRVKIIPVSIPDGQGAMEAAFKSVLSKTKAGEKTLIFCSSRKRWVKDKYQRFIWYGVMGTVDKAKKLLKALDRKDKVVFYHSDLPIEAKDKAAKQFINGSANIMVATSAFGTGVDVSDIRNVIHIGAPQGLEAWYQESGRAGRDGSPSMAYVLLDRDDEILEQAISKAASIETRKRVEKLREELSKVIWQGSFMRQMKLLLGGVDAKSLGLQVNVRKPLANPFMGSFPGAAFETRVYSNYVLEKVMKKGKGSARVVEFHKHHEEYIWKAINRLVYLGLVNEGYERIYKMAEGNLFHLERAPGLEIAGSSRALLDKVIEFARELLGGGYAEWLHEQIHDQGISSDVFEERILAANKALIFTIYDAVGRIRLNSFDHLSKFFDLESDSDRASFLNGYLSTDPQAREFEELVSSESLEVEAWEKALAFCKDRLGENLVGTTSFLEKMAGDVTLSIPRFLLLYRHLSKRDDVKEAKKKWEDRLRSGTGRLLNELHLPPGLWSWIYDRLRETNEDAWLAELEHALREKDKEGEEELYSIAAARSWVMRQKDEFGLTGIAHYQVAQWIRKALN